uniref:Deacetylase sirtuin-type domain-containing protein n=1 Tax=Ditylum brightwellii TaxID=49249 RepID=A0A7S4R7Q9_9STRA|mmetsp:Transcript_21916/g.28887  ORF Transcript_21916/g.28887 Transcript_21916/m.28887 type:complete len:352 (+) Transcript_21916:99-1154(+)
MAESNGECSLPFWCNVCSLDLQSEKSLSEHRKGRKHMKRAYRQNATSNQVELPKCAEFKSSDIDEDELFSGLASGSYRNIVIVTGAGVSTAAGVPDFRSPGGLFDTLRREFGNRFPWVYEDTEKLLSRNFMNMYPDVFANEVNPLIRRNFEDLKPTLTHRFCAWLQKKGWLRRVYTSNVDGLHLHESLSMPLEVVVESHGSLHDGSIVMYGDNLPCRFFEKCNEDFPVQGGEVDLVIVIGSSLQVAPFCSVPNMAPRGCVRVLVNRCLSDCFFNNFSPITMGRHTESCEGIAHLGRMHIGSRKNVPLRPLWSERAGWKKWRQLLVESECDEFVERFFGHPLAAERGLDIDV